MALARRHCGCKGLVAVTDAGLQRLVAKLSGADMSLVEDGPLGACRIAPPRRHGASLQRLLVANGSGQIVGVRNDAEVDLDGNAMNGVTRLTFSGVSDIQAITVVNAASKELPGHPWGTGELIAWDLTNNTLCQRPPVAQVAGQGAYDVATSADALTVFVSLRKTAPLSGAVATIAASPRSGSATGRRRRRFSGSSPPGRPRGSAPWRSRWTAPSWLSAGAASTCLDQIKAADGSTSVDTQVGCDWALLDL